MTRTSIAQIMLVEDDAGLREVMAFNLEEAGYAVCAFERAREALEHYSSTSDVDVVITDLRMPGMDGMELLSRLKKLDEQAVVLIITAYGGTERAVNAMREGAFHYVEKPVNTATLLATVQKAVEHRRVNLNMHALQPERGASSQERRAAGQPIIASSPKMNRVLQLVDKIAPSHATVLIRGESGTGKELIARAIHARSPRAEKPFVTVNCAAIPPDLLESMLFGHVKGAFTGASRDAEGKFRHADGGTIFLDEVAELPLHLQPKLLRVLQEGEIEIVGGRPIEVDTRVIAATHQDLESLMRSGALRQDLYYRLNVVPIHIPPLRERPEDIPALTRFFMRRLIADAPVDIDRGVDDLLLSYPWPGNVRELQNIVERMVLLRDGEQLTIKDVPMGLMQGSESPELVSDVPQALLPFTLPEEGLDMVEFEKNLIQAVLDKMDGNQSAAARYLNIPRHVLLYRLEKFGLK